jgi:fructose-1,6-bisphosphatase
MFCIPDVDYFKDFNMMLNDNIIDCFLDDSSNKIESKTNDINIKNTEVETINKLEVETINKLEIETINKLDSSVEKLNKNKIHNYNLNYNGYRIIGNVKPIKNSRDFKNERDYHPKSINDDTRPGRIKKNNSLKYE